MKRPVKLLPIISLLFLFLLCCPAFSAPTLKAPAYQLADVTQAKIADGVFISKNGKKHFKAADGRLLKSRWINLNGSIYYLDKKGRKFTGWVIYRGNRYRTGPHSLYIRRKFVSAGKTYYAGKKGRVAVSRWIKLDGDTYYAGPRGILLTGEHFINGKWVYFDKNGKYKKNHVFLNKVDPSRPMLALTFDDGPGPYTDRLLSCLNKYHARATFFMVGTSVPGRASTIRRMKAIGCELGDHSDTHARMTTLSSSGIYSEFASCAAKIRSACGSSPTVCRLPYGEGHNSSWVLSSTAGLPSIYWSVDTRDWANTGNPQSTINAALSGASSGAIILMHDIHYSTVIAAETIIPALINRGYQLVTVSELAKYKGHTSLYSGRTYYHF